MSSDLSGPPASPADSPPALEVIIRFKNSAGTLPAVLSALAAQTFQSFRLLGVDTGSSDSSGDLIRQAGGTIVFWKEAYSHPKVLNFGVEHAQGALILALSSHTSLTAPDTLERMVAAMQDPEVACVSAKWDEDPYYSDRVTWEEIQEKGLKFGSIYSNSMGMFRRSFWEEERFDESLDGCEDYAWAVAQLRRGHVAVRMNYPFTYERSRNDRVHHLCLNTHLLAKKHGLEVAWMGAKGTVKELVKISAQRLLGRGDREELTARYGEHREKLRAWMDSRRRTA